MFSLGLGEGGVDGGEGGQFPFLLIVQQEQDKHMPHSTGHIREARAIFRCGLWPTVTLQVK